MAGASLMRSMMAKAVAASAVLLTSIMAAAVPIPTASVLDAHDTGRVAYVIASEERLAQSMEVEHARMHPHGEESASGGAAQNH